MCISGQYLQNQCNPTDLTCVRCPERLPSCEGLPDGENPVPGHQWSHDYVRCYKNRTLSVGSCRNGYFNPQTGKCVNSIKKGMHAYQPYLIINNNGKGKFDMCNFSQTEVIDSEIYLFPPYRHLLAHLQRGQYLKTRCHNESFL